MRFAGLYNSNRAGKKFMIWFEEPRKIIHFGSAGSSTYLDHGDKKKERIILNVMPLMKTGMKLMRVV